MAYGSNFPFGLVAVFSNDGSEGTQKTAAYKIAASSNGAVTYNQSIFSGDPVIKNPVLTIGTLAIGQGCIAPFVPTADATVNPPLGVFQSCKYIDTKGNTVMSPNWIAGTPILPGSQIIAYVNDDPNQLYSVQVSSSNPAIINALLTNEDIGLNANLAIASPQAWTGVPAGMQIPNLNPGTGNLSTGISGFYLDGSTIAVTATLVFKILGFDTNINNTKNYIYPIDPATGLYAPANNLGVGGGFFLNAIGKFNVHAQGSNGTIGVKATA